MKFLPAENKIVVSTYSPVINQYARDDQNQFDIEYAMHRDNSLITGHHF